MSNLEKYYTREMERTLFIEYLGAIMKTSLFLPNNNKRRSCYINQYIWKYATWNIFTCIFCDVGVRSEASESSNRQSPNDGKLVHHKPMYSDW